MKLKTALSFLLVFIISHSCKQVYEVDLSKPNNEANPYHIFFINRSLDDELGVIVTDTSKREINFFYGEKNSEGGLINVEQIITYLPQHKLLMNFDLDENLFPKSISISRNDTTITAQFKNYDLRANTTDVEIFDTQNKLIESRTRVWCGDAILKFKEAKRQFDLKKGLRLSEQMDLNSECIPFLNSLITASNGIGCFLGVVALPITGFSTLSGIGAILFANDLLFTATNCGEALGGLQAIFKGECLPEDNWIEEISTINSCKKELWESIRKRRNPVTLLLRLLNQKDGIECITDLFSDLLEALNKYLQTPLPEVPSSSTRPTDYYVGGKSFGDPNIVTFDGKSYSFNGVGEFVAVKSTVDNFEVQVRQEELRSRNASGSISWNTGVAINTGNDRLCFYPAKYFINGTQYMYGSAINNTLKNGGSITGNSAELTINTNGDIVKVFNRNDVIDYSVVPASQRQGKMIGIFGDYNNNADNDVQVRNSSIIDGSYNSLYPAFTDSWRISQDQSLFVYDAGKNTTSYTDRNFPRTPLVISAAQRLTAEQICKNAGVFFPFLDGCINDVAATGDASIAQRAKELQDESTLRSFDIKFGPNEDKSLLFLNINADKYGPDYLLCEEFVYPEISKPVPLTNGFETVIYLASERPDPRTSILASRLSLKFLSAGFEWSVSGGSSYNFYDGMLNFLTAIDPKIYIFDGKMHKIVIQSNIDLSKKTSSYRLFFDDVIILERKDFNIRAFDVQNKIPFNQGINLSFGAASGAPRVKLYRWSFKSY